MKKLFVIMPFGVRQALPAHNLDEIDFDLTYRSLIKPAGELAGWTVLRIDESVQPGVITNQYLKEILEADAVLADISLPNANVYYELGIRHAISNGSTILIALEGSDIPFDLANQRVFFYTLTGDQLQDARRMLASAISFEPSDDSQTSIRSFLESLGAIVNPKADPVAFERELQGRIERAQNREQLIAVWKWAKNMSPLPPFTVLTLAKRLSSYNEWAFSVEALKAALAERPNDFELCRELGWHLSKVGADHEREALTWFEHALSLNPDDPETLGMMAGVFKRQGRYERASLYYSKGATISPNSPYMLVNQAAMKILTTPTNPEEGKTLYRNLILRLEANRGEPPDEWTELVLGEAFFALGELRSAREHFLVARNIASSPKSLRSAADQLEIFANIGFESSNALELAKSLRLGAEELIAKVEVRNTPHDGERTSGAKHILPVLLHVSDIHFGRRVGKDGQYKQMHRFRDGEFSIRLSRHIIEEFSSKRRHFTHNPEQLHLLVSGDLTYTAKKEEFDLVETFLDEVCEGLQISKERVLIVPGNHDVSWEVGRVDLSHRFDNYIAFLDSFYGEDLFRTRHPRISWDLRIGSKRPAPGDIVSFYHNSEVGLTIVGLNSCVYETDQDHYGFIGGKQMRVVSELLDEYVSSTAGCRVAMFHHHIHPFPELVDLPESGDIKLDLSTIRDAGIVERWLESLRFDLVLHGHKHKPQVRETCIKNTANSDLDVSKLIVCGAGSVGVNSIELEHNVSNHYEVIEFLRNPRKKDVDFLKVEWRILEVSPEAEWATSGTWRING